jgi:glycosyltransferase involved in cell wall biosynthesis
MKICLASIHPWRLSGQIDSLVALTRELEELGHVVRVVSAFDRAVLFRGTAGRIGWQQGASLGGKLAGVLRSVRRLANPSDEVDLIHLNLPTPAFSWLADLLLLRLGGSPPLVVGYEAHLADVRELLRGGYVWRDPRFYLPLIAINNGLWGRVSAYRCRRYVVASRWQRAELRALGADEARVTSLPNLVDRRKLDPMPKEAARQAIIREAMPNGPRAATERVSGGPLVGWVGHFHHVKGIDVLLDAFGQLGRDRPDTRLALAWSGIGNPRPIEARIEALGLGGRVLKLGRVEMGPFMSALDVLALPYRLTIDQEAFPNLVLEAMTVGVPLVTSDLPLLRELLEDSRTALLARPDDPESLAAALGRLLDEPALAAGMVDAQRTLMASDLHPTGLARRYVALYQEVLSEAAEATQPARPPLQA